MLSQICSEKLFKKHLTLYLNITAYITLMLYLKPCKNDITAQPKDGKFYCSELLELGYLYLFLHQ